MALTRLVNFSCVPAGVLTEHGIVAAPRLDRATSGDLNEDAVMFACPVGPGPAADGSA